MKYLFILMFFTSSPIWSQDRLNDENYYRKFPIEEMILGEWFLEKIEMIGLNKNDSSSIVSIESGKDRIVFYKKTYKTLPDTNNSRFYRPSHEFYYKIEKNNYSDYREIAITEKKGKKSFENFTILHCTFDKLLLEDFEVNSILGEKYSKVNYHYKRKCNDYSKIVGKWLLNDNVNLFFYKDKDTIWHTLSNFSELNQDSLSELQQKTEIEFKEDNNYTILNSSTYTAVFGGATYIVDSKDKRIYFISKEVEVYEYTFDIKGNLKIKYKNRL